MQSTRRQQREVALQLSYALYKQGGTWDEQVLRDTIDNFELQLTDFGRMLVQQAMAHYAEYQERIYAQAKSPDMISEIDMLLMAMGICEIYQQHSGLAVIINEYIELSKSYGAEKAYRFVHVVLNAARIQAPEDLA